MPNLFTGPCHPLPLVTPSASTNIPGLIISETETVLPKLSLR